MIEAVIRWSVQHRILVLLAAVTLTLSGLYAVKHTPIDAIPDLSDVQVIVKTSYPGQSPQVVEDQITYPLTTALMSVPGARTVRGFSFFQDSYVYIIFDEDTDIYWARSRVLEYLNQVSDQLPQGVSPALGPDATGVGWVYLYALLDETNTHSLADLRAIQDWFLKYELQSVSGVSEVASLGGMVKQYQLQISVPKLRAYNIPLSHIKRAVERGNQESGASVVELAEAEYMVTATGYLQDIASITQLPLGVTHQGVPLTVGDVATVVESPTLRRGIAELNGKGEVVGGVIVMRYGENAQATITRVKQKLAALADGLPDGVRIIPVYDRSTLIGDAVNTLWSKLIEELIVVGVVCMVFLFHLRSSLVAIISLPVGILCAFILMKLQGLNANIMSLGGIAIAIGAMVDGAIVMVENLHKHIEQEELRTQGAPLTNEKRWSLVIASASEVGPALFFSLLIITVSFVPIFALEAQEGRLFSPLAYTKTYAMAAAAALAITLVPVLSGYFVRGHIRSESHNPVHRGLLKAYLPLLTQVLNHPKKTLFIALVLLISVVWPLNKMGSEFMPTLNEGSLMYMPSTDPGISVGKARELLQQTDKLIATVPEVAQVFGKVGRAETATDPAPLTMMESFIELKPKSQWRDGMTMEDIVETLDARIQLPGVTNAWVMPIKTRIDMLATGIKTPVGIKISGPELQGIEEIGEQIEALMSRFPNTESAYFERVVGGRYVNIDINREKAARYGINVADIHEVLSIGVGGVAIGETYEGRERYAISMRLEEAYRHQPEAMGNIPIITQSGLHIPVSEVATITIENGPAAIKSENSRLNGWVLVDTQSPDLGGYVTDAKAYIEREITLPPGYALTWSGQFEYLERAKQKMMVVIPITFIIIVMLLGLSFKQVSQIAIVLSVIPLSLVGGIWLLYLLNFQFSVAVSVGFIALAGVAVETAVIMLVYLSPTTEGETIPIVADKQHLKQRILTAASRRVRPVMMTAMSIIVGLLPVLYATGTGAEVMQRIAAPLVGGMISALLVTLFIVPVVYYLVEGARRS